MRVLICACVLAGVAATQTFTVAPSGGNFTDLPTAVAAVPSGSTLLVQPGFYAPFALQNKSLTILAVGSATVQMNSDLVIGPLGSGDAVTIQGLQLEAGASLVSNDVVLQNCAGPVLFDALTLRVLAGYEQIGVRVQSCANVHLLRCDGLGNGLLANGPALDVAASTVEVSGGTWVGRGSNAGMQVRQGSTVSLAAVSVLGGNGLVTGGAAAANGHPAAHVLGGSRLHFGGLGALLRGGDGALGLFGLTSGNGGDGLLVEQASTALAWGGQLVGGSAGGVGALAGLPSRADASSSLAVDASQRTPRGTLTGTFAPGNAISFDLANAPSQLAWLSLGSTPVAAPGPWLDFGLVGVVAWGTVGPVFASAAGAGSVAVVVPQGWPTNVVLLAQWFTFDPVTNRILASNTFTARS